MAMVEGLPFDAIADPDKRLHVEFGVRSGLRALLDPRVWPTILVAVARSLPAVALRRERPPALSPHGGRLGLPADFLIPPDGRVLGCHRGAHAADHWTVDDVLDRVVDGRPLRTGAVGAGTAGLPARSMMD